MAKETLNGYEACMQYGSLNNDVAMMALGEEAAELLFEEETISVEEATEILEDRVTTAQRPQVSRVYRIMDNSGIIDLDSYGDLFNADNAAYAKNGHCIDEVIEFVNQYNHASSI